MKAGPLFRKTRSIFDVNMPASSDKSEDAGGGQEEN